VTNKQTNRIVRRNCQKRRGATAVEFALTAPLLFLFVFAGIEFSRAMLVRHAVQSAAMAGARVGIIPGADIADCELAANDALDLARIQGTNVVVEPTGGITSTTELVTVTVTADMNSNSLPMSKFIIGRQMAQTITLRRENHGE
jgi:Flp pilus assembly protein TadG